VFVDHNDSKSVAQGIIGLLTKTNEQRLRVGVEARARIIEHYSYEKRRAAIQRVIEDLSLRQTPRA
jgi:hypothetical protein